MVVAPEAARLHELLLEQGYDTRIVDTYELLVRGVTTAEVGELAGSACVNPTSCPRPPRASSLEEVFLELTAKEA